jgi:hypothetical protein
MTKKIKPAKRPSEKLVEDARDHVLDAYEDLPRRRCLVRGVNTISVPTELLVLSGRGIRFGVPSHYGLFDETPTFEAAVKTARAYIAKHNGNTRGFVAIRIEAEVIDGIGEGTERELVRFEVYPDRVALVPADQGGLSDAQASKVSALPRRGLL